MMRAWFPLRSADSVGMPPGVALHVGGGCNRGHGVALATPWVRCGKWGASWVAPVAKAGVGVEGGACVVGLAGSVHHRLPVAG